MNRCLQARLVVINLCALVASPASLAGADSGSNAGEALNRVVVGHNDLGWRGFNADGWTHNGYAYAGQ
jgi:hypothetical protein